MKNFPVTSLKGTADAIRYEHQTRKKTLYSVFNCHLLYTAWCAGWLCCHM